MVHIRKNVLSFNLSKLTKKTECRFNYILFSDKDTDKLRIKHS